MRYVVDAYNLIFKDDKLHDTFDARGFVAVKEMLVEIMSRFARSGGVDEVILVFDGSQKAAHRPRTEREASGRVVILYSDPRSEADHLIIQLIEDATQPGGYTVITSDKFIIRHVLRAQGKHQGCRDFLREMRRSMLKAADPLGGEDPRKFSNGALTPREMEEWMEYFGFKEGE